MKVVDVGANHGLFALEASHLIGPTGIVYGFEPAPATAAQLKMILKRNAISNVVIEEAAVGGFCGEVQLRIHETRTGLNTLAKRDILWQGKILHADRVVSIPQITLDTFVERIGITHVDVLKIDVEGFELGVLQGASSLLKRKAVSFIMLEIDEGTYGNADVDPRSVVEEIERHDYSLYEITADGECGDRVGLDHRFSPSANYLAKPN